MEEKMKDMLKGQVALITGATSGMGEATAKLYAAEGAAVILGGRSADKGEKIAKEIIDAGGIARYYGPMDVTSMDSIKDTVGKRIAEFGQIDILATYAGKTFDGLGLTPDEQFQKTMDFNLKSTYDTVFAVLPYMKERKTGKIIICSSNGAFNPTTPAYDYHMSKGACESLTVNLAMDVAPLGIRVNCIKPGPIVTAFWDELMDDGPERDSLFDGIAKHEVPMERLGTADDIAGPALFFASELSSYITGLCLYVGGGIGYVYAHGQSYLLAHAPRAEKE